MNYPVSKNIYRAFRSEIQYSIYPKPTTRCLSIRLNNPMISFDEIDEKLVNIAPYINFS